jgi:hypothetical protein
METVALVLIILMAVLGGPVLLYALFVICTLGYSMFCGGGDMTLPRTREGDLFIAQSYLHSTGGIQRFHSVYGRMPTHEELHNAWKNADPEQRARLLPYLAQYGINPQVV